jgi:hypothetical protein
MDRGATVTMTRNRVKILADEKGWDEDVLWAQVVINKERNNVSISTVTRLYRDPDYLGLPRSLQALARVFGVTYNEMTEDIPSGTQ